MNIEFIRGDTKKLRFRLEDTLGDELVLVETDKLFFTVKKDAIETAFKFQKTISNGIEYSSGYYYISIEPTDTNSLVYGDYKYDLELVSNTLTKTLVIGTMTILPEVTFVTNEV
jgi:thiamine pyrophosphokinase